MFKRIRNKIRQFFRKDSIRHLSNFYVKGDSTILLPSFAIRLDNPEDGRQYLHIGCDNIIGGVFVFESNKGEITIGNNTFIGASTFISRSAITVGNYVNIAFGCTIYDHNSHSTDHIKRRDDIINQLRDMRQGLSSTAHKNWETVKTAPIRIEDDVWIGMNCIILNGVTIGRGAVVGAGSVVTHDVPAWTLVAGNPAKIIRQLPH